MVPFTKRENSNPYINITNNSGKPIKVTFEHNIEQTDHNYKLSIYVGNHECKPPKSSSKRCKCALFISISAYREGLEVIFLLQLQVLLLLHLTLKQPILVKK